jgi:hypothetical protein
MMRLLLFSIHSIKENKEKTKGAQLVFVGASTGRGR